MGSIKYLAFIALSFAVNKLGNIKKREKKSLQILETPRIEPAPPRRARSKYAILCAMRPPYFKTPLAAFPDSPISNKVWNYRTHGLTSVGQDEVVVLVVQLPGNLTVLDLIS